MKKLCLLIVLVAFVFYSLPGWAADTVRIAHSAISALEEAYNTYAIKFMARLPYPTLKGVETILEDLAKTNPKARSADPKRFVEPRFLKELDDSGFAAQLYR